MRIVVERGALEVHDGVGPHRGTRSYEKATHGLRRLVIANAAGTVSLDALRWCNSLGVGVLVLGGDGTAQLASTPRMTDDARLRRTQGLAPREPYGYEIAQYLLAAKLTGQARNLVRHFGDEDTASSILGLVDALDCPPSVGLPAGSDELARLSIDHLRQIEASGRESHPSVIVTRRRLSHDHTHANGRPPAPLRSARAGPRLASRFRGRAP
ncbi:MAG: CRISPR-associated endonuclease Cas1 [Acidimicrobiales bacterium]